MTAISRSYVDALTRSLNTLSEATQAVARAQLAAIEYTDIADLRNQVIAILEPLLSIATDIAAGYAAQTYDRIREASVGSATNAVARSGRIPEATERAVRALVGEVDKSGYEAFTRSVEARCDYEIKKAAGESTLYNAERDPRKPKWARIPTGAETCTFCLMLASRGFVYRSKESAGALNHWHPHCDCRIVPGFDGMEIEGYDPDKLYRKWKDAEEEKRLNQSDRNPDDIFVPREKIADYSLTNPDKARMFKSLLGYEKADASELRDKIIEAIDGRNFVSKGTDKWGERFQQDIVIQGKNGKVATVRTAWIRESEDSIMRLVSAYVKE